jgi:hypothetical protein
MLFKNTVFDIVCLPSRMRRDVLLKNAAFDIICLPSRRAVQEMRHDVSPKEKPVPKQLCVTGV